MENKSNFNERNPNNTIQSSDDEIDVALYLRAFYRYKWGILSITLLSGVIGLLVASNLVPMYQAKSSLLIESQNKVNEVQLSPLLPELNLNSFRRTQVDLLRSRTLAEQVIKKLNLEPNEKPAHTELTIFQSLLDSLKKTVLQDNKKPVKIDHISSFLSNLNIIEEKKSELIFIQYQSADQNIVSKVANEIADSYIQMIQKEREITEKQNISWLSKKLEEVRLKLVDSQAKLESYQEKAQIQTTADEQRIKDRRIDKITQELINARTRKSDAVTRFTQIKSLVKQKGKNSVLAIVKEPYTERLREEESKLERTVKELSTRYGDKHPKIIAAKSDLKIAKRQIAKEVDKILLNAKREYDLAVANEKQMQQLYNELYKRTNTVKGVTKKAKEFGLSKMEREVSTNRELYNLLLVKLKTTDINKRDELQNVKIVDRATKPTRPFKPNKKLVIILSIVVGLMLGVFVAMIRVSLDKTFKTIDDVREMLGIPILGIVPKMRPSYMKKYRLEHLVKLQPRSTIAETFNNIRTNIILGKNNADNKTILVTSSIASEGKTTISSNLGMALSLLGPTLIIEADARKPRFKRMLHLPCQGGLLEYLGGKHSLKQSVVRDPDLTNLYTMPVNAIPAHPAEIFASAQFGALLKQLKKKFKYIVIDSPPLLPVSDSLQIAQHVDGIALVIGAESTTRQCAKEALDRLKRLDAPVMGVILSQVTLKELSSYGYYGYGYGSYTGDDSGSVA
ncbi:MAG: polysaccharide biosynthesis tyrosine autokinase [Gammaproteobacteria bacterium]|nr:polysaccharide biosynthesis tyrosine autokinase [Gammaproteobacteria bacterium]